MAERRVAFVTGASRGIGRACALELAGRGLDVVVTARTVSGAEGLEHSSTVKKSATNPLPGSLETTAREARALGAETLVVKLDLAARADWPAAVDAALARFGRIDVLVNNGRYVGPGHMDPFKDTPVELIEQMMLCNVIAPLTLVKLCLPAMKRQGGGIGININSGAGGRGTPAPIGQGGWGLGYSLSKAALNRMVPGLAKELRPYNIAVIGLMPGSGRSGWRPSSPSSASTRPRHSRSRTRAGCAPCSRPRRTPCTSRARTSTARASTPSTRSCASSEREDGMRLGLMLGYWMPDPWDPTDLVQEAERLGYESVWTAEAYGSDVFSPLCWVGARTKRIKLGTAIMQISARTPACAAMTAATIDHLSGGRLVLGIGVSGPQVVEGWYGVPFPKPLARTREYVEILRKVWARDGVVTNDGAHYPLPYPGGTGLGKPL